MNSRKHNEEKTEKSAGHSGGGVSPAGNASAGRFTAFGQGAAALRTSRSCEKMWNSLNIFRGMAKSDYIYRYLDPSGNARRPHRQMRESGGLRFRNTLITALSGAGDDF